MSRPQPSADLEPDAGQLVRARFRAGSRVGRLSGTRASCGPVGHSCPMRNPIGAELCWRPANLHLGSAWLVGWLVGWLVARARSLARSLTSCSSIAFEARIWINRQQATANSQQRAKWRKFRLATGDFDCESRLQTPLACGCISFARQQRATLQRKSREFCNRRIRNIEANEQHSRSRPFNRRQLSNEAQVESQVGRASRQLHSRPQLRCLGVSSSWPLNRESQ